MLLPLLFCLLMADTEPVDVIKLETNGMYLSAMGYHRVKHMPDGSFIARTKYQLWHWDRNGNLINRFGQKGPGPGEFQALGAYYWNGEYYWVVDSNSLMSNLFDRNGKFLSRKALYFRQLLPVGDQLFAVDYSRANQFAENHPRSLQELSFNVVNNELQVERTGMLFYKISQRQVNLVLNFKLIWMVREDDTFYLVNQVEPRLYIYDEDARTKEAMLDIKDPPQNPKFAELALPFYEEPPNRFIKGRSQRALSLWWRSWSRLNYFNRLGKDFVVAYEIPNPEDPGDTLQAAVLIDRRGRTLSRPLVLDQFVIGSRDEHLMLFREGEDDDFEYFVDLYELKPGKK